MTNWKPLKRAIRQRMRKTRESYSSARRYFSRRVGSKVFIEALAPTLRTLPQLLVARQQIMDVGQRMAEQMDIQRHLADIVAPARLLAQQQTLDVGQRMAEQMDIQRRKNLGQMGQEGQPDQADGGVNHT